MLRIYRTKSKPEKIVFARGMRHNPTLAESLLWQSIRSNKLGVKFRRQCVILGYIVDFWCPSKRVAIEVDGKIHEKQKAYDIIRDKRISSLEIRILRITNEAVIENKRNVIKRIAGFPETTP